jgi:putative membrane protein
MEYYGSGGFGVVELVWVLLWVLFVALVLALLILAIRWFLRAERGAGVTPSGPPAGPDPLQILRERYARGEIDDEEYERRRKVLGG